MRKKLILTILLSLPIAVLLITAFMGSAVGSADLQPGSKEDPLVTKSYVDRYLNERIGPLENSIKNLANQVAQLEKRVNDLKANLKPPIRLTINDKTAHVGQQTHTLETAPFTVDGRTMVPFRFIGEALGAKVDWEPGTRNVSYVLGDTRIEFPIGSTTVMINGQAHRVDVPASLVGGRTFVPVRMVSEQLGARVDWNPSTRQVTIFP